MSEYIIGAAYGLMLGALAWLTLHQTYCRRCKVFDLLSEKKEYPSLTIKPFFLTMLVMLIAVGSAAATFFVLRRVPDTANRLRLLLMLIPTVAAGMIDLRENRIPNVLVLFLTAIGIGFLTYIFFAERDFFESYLVSSAIACIGTVVLLALISKIAKKGIGAGDIKLLGGLGLAGGVHILIGTVLFGTIGFLIVGVALLLLKKKTWKSSLPFGPFILLGLLLTLVFYSY